MRTLSVLLSAFTLMLATAAQAKLFDGSYALVVGISEYPPSSGFRKLDYARRDAEGIARFLRAQGFEVIELLDDEATRAAIVSAMEDRLAPLLGEGDRILVFFSGHGMTRIIGSEEYGYVVPYDATGQSSSWIGMDALRGLSAKMGEARHQFFIMDACYGGRIGLKGVASAVPVERPDYLAAVTRRTARQYLTAGGPNEQVRDGGPYGYSYFTGYLLEALEAGLADVNGDGYVTASELAAYLTPRAAAWNQTPGAGTLPGHGQGEFVFRVPPRRTATRGTAGGGEDEDVLFRGDRGDQQARRPPTGPVIGEAELREILQGHAAARALARFLMDSGGRKETRAVTTIVVKDVAAAPGGYAVELDYYAKDRMGRPLRGGGRFVFSVSGDRVEVVDKL